MTLNSLLNSIGLIGINDNLVNWAGCGPSIYRANALTIKNYPFLFCSPTGTHRVDENWTTYAVSIFYVSRLLEDNSNEMDIQSTAVEVLKNIIRKIRNINGVTDISDEYSINVFVEYEKFADRCTGAYATVEISVVNDTICEVNDTNNKNKLYSVFYHTTDGNPVKVLDASWGAELLLNRTFEEREYTHIDGNTYIVNGELMFFGEQPVNVPELAFFDDVAGGSALDAIYLPDTIEAVGSNAFAYCRNLTTIGGTASTDNIVSYAWHPFYETKLAETFEIGSKCIYIGSRLFEEMGYDYGDTVRVNMPVEQFRNGVAHDCEWASFSPVSHVQFTDTTIVPDFEFDEIQDVAYDTTQITATFSTDTVIKIFWEVWNGDEMVGNGSWCDTQGKSIDFTLSANTGTTDIEYTLLAKLGSNTAEIDRITFKQEGMPAEETNSALTTDFAVGSAVTSADEIIPYGLYALRWDAQDKYAKLTKPFNQVYLTDRFKYTFTTANVENGVMQVHDVQRIRIVRAVPMSDIPELEGAKIYIRDYPNQGDNLYTGPSYLLYDIYNEKFLSYGGTFFLHFRDASDFVGNQDKAGVVVNAFSNPNDSCVIGMRAPFEADSTSDKPRAYYASDKEYYVLGAAEQSTNSGRPYNFDTDSDWSDIKVSLIPMTAIEQL